MIYEFILYFYYYENIFIIIIFVFFLCVVYKNIWDVHLLDHILEITHFSETGQSDGVQNWRHSSFYLFGIYLHVVSLILSWEEKKTFFFEEEKPANITSATDVLSWLHVYHVNFIVCHVTSYCMLSVKHPFTLAHVWKWWNCITYLTIYTLFTLSVTGRNTSAMLLPGQFIKHFVYKSFSQNDKKVSTVVYFFNM